MPNVGSQNDLNSQGAAGRLHAPHRIHQNQNYNPQNMAYVNISSDGAKPVGPIGLKRAEKELIMRRYKYHHQNDNINRVALIYGQQHPQFNSHDQYIGEGIGAGQGRHGHPGGRGQYISGVNIGNGSY